MSSVKASEIIVEFYLWKCLSAVIPYMGIDRSLVFGLIYYYIVYVVQ